MNDRKNNKSYVFLIIFIILAIALLVFMFRDKIFPNQENADTNTESNVSRLALESNVDNAKLDEINNRVENIIESPPPRTEEEIASFSTKLGRKYGK